VGTSLLRLASGIHNAGAFAHSGLETTVIIQRTGADSIAKELQRLDDAINQRACELYLESRHPSVLDNWIAAEQQLVKRPAVELHEHDSQIEVLADLSGFQSDSIEVQVASQELLIHARSQSGHPKDDLSGDGADAIGIVHLADEIDPETVYGEFNDGQLRLTMSLHAQTHVAA
jgi:HSP20 family molecular chaperone IbpA